MKRFRALMIVAACALTGVALPVLAGGFGDGFGGGAGAGVAYLATQFCALTGCTMTGQQVFSGVTTDISTGTNENLVVSPNGTGITDVVKSAQSASSEVMQRVYVSDVTSTKFHIRMENLTSSESSLLPGIAGFANTTSTNHPGLQIRGVIPSTRDALANTGAVLLTCQTSTDGATGTLGGSTLNPCVTFRTHGTDRAHIGWGGAWIDDPQTLTVADNGGGTAAAGTLNPAGGFHRCTCNDANGCTITVGETGVRAGQVLTVECTTANACNFADTAGTTEIAGAFACATNDTLELRYNGTAWVETGRSDN